MDHVPLGRGLVVHTRVHKVWTTHATCRGRAVGVGCNARAGYGIPKPSGPANGFAAEVCDRPACRLDLLVPTRQFAQTPSRPVSLDSRRLGDACVRVGTVDPHPWSQKLGRLA